MDHQLMRQGLKAFQRRYTDLGFCDDNEARRYAIETDYRTVRALWEAEAAAACMHPVIQAALEASSTDNVDQTIDNVLANSRSFWSSTGSSRPDAEESLLFELAGPACRVACVQLAAYRAFFQQGYPVYPPMQLQVWIGPAPHQLQPASPVMQVQATDALQTFALHAHAPVGRYLQLRLIGKLQRQQGDLAFYVAIRHVSARGTRLPHHMAALQPLLRLGRQAGPCVGPGGQLPGTCCSHGALEAAVELDVSLGRALAGPAAAAAAAAAGPDSLPSGQLQQQEQEEGAAAGQLVVHQQTQTGKCRSRQRRQRRRRQQEQRNQRQPGGRGLWAAVSSFGRRITAGGSNSEEVAAVSRATAAAHGNDNGSRGGSGGQQQQQQQQKQCAAARPRWLEQQPSDPDTEMASAHGSSNGSSSESDIESDGGGGGDRMRRRAAAAAAAGQADGPDAAGDRHAQLELMLWQAVQGLGAGDQEGLLALLEDEPLVPRDQAAAAGPGGSSSSSSSGGTTFGGHAKQQQQQCGGSGAAAAAAALRPVLSPSRCSDGGGGVWACQGWTAACSAQFAGAQLVLQVRGRPSSSTGGSPATAGAAVVVALPGTELFLPAGWQQQEQQCCLANSWVDEAWAGPLGA